MDEIMRQRDPALKEAVEASLKGDIERAFGKLGDNIEAVKRDNLAGAAAARWLALSPEERAKAGLMAPSHRLREKINAIVRERLVRDGAVRGPAMNTERLVSRGYTNAEKTLSSNYRRGDVVAFHRPYKRLGVEKGDELRVAGIDRKARTVRLEGNDGQRVAWEPNRLAARAGGVEVYRRETMGASRRRPHPLDAQRCRPGARQQPDRRRRGGAGRPGDVSPRGRTHARHERRRPAASPHRPRLGDDRACVPGPHRRHRDRGDAGRTIPTSPTRRRSMWRYPARATAPSW